MVDIYRAYIALGEYNVEKADNIIEDCKNKYSGDSTFLFETAQYYARRCKYEKAIEYYERSWNINEKPRYTDAMQGIATIYKILGDKDHAIEAYDRMLECLKVEWGYSSDDKPYIETERDRANILKSFNQ